VVKVGELFPQPEPGVCAVCPNDIPEDSRKRRYCSNRCRDVAYATQKLFDWKRIRKRVMEKSDLVCQICGYDKDRYEELRERVKEGYDLSYGPKIDQKIREEHGMERREMELDHIKPVSKGGSMFNEENLQITCASCNRKKSDKWRGEPSIFDFYDQTRDSEE
jgi:5-methylcytosine-specific restriction endonuclease McrA